MLYKRATFFDLLDLTRGRTIDDVHSDLFIRIFWIIFFFRDVWLVGNYPDRHRDFSAIHNGRKRRKILAAMPGWSENR